MKPPTPFHPLFALAITTALGCAQVEPREPPGLLHGMEPDDAELDLRRTPVVRAVERARDAVVSIFIARDGTDVARGVDGEGSGVILDAGGLVITNWHVVAPVSAGLRSAVVLLRNGKQFQADLISSSPEHDLALLQLRTEEPVEAIVVGDSDSLMVGETVIAIGNPQGLHNSVTVGVLSSTERGIAVRAPDGVVRRYEGLLQTDAAINQGNSGGALIDITGKLIGISNAMAVGVENIGYAIPINTVRRVFEEVLVASENLASVWLGMKVEEREGTAVVAAVDPLGPAAKAGIRAGDRIEQAGGRDVRGALDYARATIRARSGVGFPVKIARDKHALAMDLVPISKLASELARRTGLEVEAVTADTDRKLVETATRELYTGARTRYLRLLPAVLRVTAVHADSPAAELQLRRGDVLIAVPVQNFFNRGYQPLRSAEELADLARDRAGGSLPLVLMRDGEILSGELEVLR